MKNACLKDPEIGKTLKIHEQRGRPRLEVEQPDLLKTIVDLVSFGASAEDKRRSEALNSCKTLTDLQKELSTLGFNISRSATYLRLLPKRANSSEGKRHIETVLVRLKRAQTSLHKNHIDQNFCTATIRSVETLASILGPRQCIFLSQDDKARVPLGITAANKQAPILMHLDYQIRLPDHDWVVADRHKLIPSVYALISIKEEQMGRPEAVSYSGPTYIAIRSGKHASSTASTHASDFERLLEIESCRNIMINSSTGKIKPVLFISVDGGPDENPRYPRVIQHVIAHFKKHDLDAVYVFTNAPGRSAFNRVERRMAPLSKELSGVILEHEHFGSHLSNSGKTVDIDLEKKNFKHAGDVLASIWNGVVIDKYEVVAEYVESVEQMENLELPSAEWYSVHVRESQYLLQVVKCSDENCCSPYRSGLKFVLPDGFLPPPYVITQTLAGLETPPPDSHGQDKFAPLLLRLSINVKPSHENFIKMPYDYFCPSVQKDLLDRTCKLCGMYFVTKKGVKSHKEKVHAKVVSVRKVKPRRVIARRNEEILCSITDSQLDNNLETVEWVDEDIVDLNEVEIPNETSTSPSSIPIISDLKLWTINDQFEEDI